MTAAASQAPPRQLALAGVGYLGLYILLDWSSYVSPLGPFAITPWNPGIGLSLALILLYGARMLPLMCVAPFIAEAINRQVPAPLPVYLAVCIIMGIAYSAASLFLRSGRLSFDIAFRSMPDLMILMTVASISAAAVAFTVVPLITVAGLLGWDEFWWAVLTYWVGDVIGIAVVTPFVMVAATRSIKLRPTVEGGAQFLAIGAALAAVFATPSGPNIQLFYFLFLPAIWIALRAGLEGVTWALAITQLGLMAAIYLSPSRDINVTTLQLLMLVLTFTSLATGLLVTERRLAELQMLRQQEDHARIDRLGSLGELATGIAHEVNQPLMAAVTYARMAEQSLGETVPQIDHARDAARKTVIQLDRAANVIRSLRNLVKLGSVTAAPAVAAHLVTNAIDFVAPLNTRSRIKVRQDIPAGLIVHVDALHIEQVLVNLLRNAIEAIAESSTAGGAITISARPLDRHWLKITIQDTGPGFSSEAIGKIGLPFRSTKHHGLGIGLALSSSIVEAHGGRLWASPCATGAEINLTLPMQAGASS